MLYMTKIKGLCFNILQSIDITLVPWLKGIWTGQILRVFRSWDINVKIVRSCEYVPLCAMPCISWLHLSTLFIGYIYNKLQDVMYFLTAIHYGLVFVRQKRRECESRHSNITKMCGTSKRLLDRNMYWYVEPPMHRFSSWRAVFHTRLSFLSALTL